MVKIKSLIFENFVVGDDSPPIIQAILNISPESFYKGSVVDSKNILEKINEFINNGAKILDIGARSTAPGSTPISIDEEYHRVESILKIVLNKIPKGIILSIDTQYSSVAELCLKECDKKGIHLIINDVSGLKTDPNMLNFVVEHSLPLILMASNNRPGDTKSINEIMDSLYNSINLLIKNNYPIQKLIIDPGIGKWVPEKTYEYDLSIIDNLDRFRIFGCPILVGISRKSFIGTVLGHKMPNDRYWGSLSATSIAVYNGAHIIRTHDVTKELLEMIKVAYAIRSKNLSIKNEEKPMIGTLINYIKDPHEAELYLKLLGVSKEGSKIMADKMTLKLIRLDNITAPQALILKQEFLARGGDVAIHRNVITTENKKYVGDQTVLLIGTDKQYYSLIEKLKDQQLGLDKIAKLLLNIIKKIKNQKEFHYI
ncbi:MAG: dihydropteroate synthase [Promethearchaeota archaeon]